MFASRMRRWSAAHYPGAIPTPTLRLQQRMGAADVVISKFQSPPAPRRECNGGKPAQVSVLRTVFDRSHGSNPPGEGKNLGKDEYR
jgi:hypothetical protein